MMFLDVLKRAPVKVKDITEKILLSGIAYGIKYYKVAWANIERWGNSIFDDQNSALNIVEAQYLIEIKSKEYANGVEWYFDATDDVVMNLKSTVHRTLKLTFLDLQERAMMSFYNIKLISILKQKINAAKKERGTIKDEHHIFLASNVAEIKTQVISFTKALKDFLSALLICQTSINPGIIPHTGINADRFLHRFDSEKYYRRE
jgi:hypothetical protein